MKIIFGLIFVVLVSGCSTTKPVREEKELLSKYPKCYHINRKIFEECVRQNQGGNEITALEIENNGLPK